MFREKGTEVSVADLMEAAELTRGGFHKQFVSKVDLVDEAIDYASARRRRTRRWRSRNPPGTTKPPAAR
ncbi:TetR family transcriptional regulator [Streptomyces sp. NBC_01527]|uniref:TetR family transcriptional regulator n=1 Tax=unclassified Streptomyces TaxID=2593676 RepID=UPI002E0F633C|nr:TetR family transcriptional regulator [Streptomyces sp. NBC_01230]